MSVRLKKAARALRVRYGVQGPAKREIKGTEKMHRDQELQSNKDVTLLFDEILYTKGPESKEMHDLRRHHRHSEVLKGFFEEGIGIYLELRRIHAKRTEKR